MPLWLFHRQAGVNKNTRTLLKNYILTQRAFISVRLAFFSIIPWVYGRTRGDVSNEDRQQQMRL